MIVTRGQIIKIDISNNDPDSRNVSRVRSIRLERNSETPGLITATDREGRVFEIHGYEVDSFCAALKKARDEDIAYRTCDNEF